MCCLRCPILWYEANSVSITLYQLFITMCMLFSLLTSHPLPLSLPSSLSPSVLTRSVDVTISSLLDGRVQYDPIPTLHDSLRPTHTNAVTTETTQPKKPKKLTIKDCHQNFEERKKSLLEQARRYVCGISQRIQLTVFHPL